MAQSVQCPALDLSSGLDIRVMSSSPTLGVELTLKRKIVFKKINTLDLKRGRKEEMGIWGMRPACAKAWRLQGAAGNLVLSWCSGKCRTSSYVMS